MITIPQQVILMALINKTSEGRIYKIDLAVDTVMLGLMKQKELPQLRPDSGPVRESSPRA